MRELNQGEIENVQGGIIITTAVVTLIVSGIVASIYLGNSLVSLALYNRSGQMPAQPDSNSMSQLTNELVDIAKIIPVH